MLRVIGLSPCQPDHAFKSSTTIKVITMQSLWPSSSLWKVRDPVTKDLHNHFNGEFNHATNSEWKASFNLMFSYITCSSVHRSMYRWLSLTINTMQSWSVLSPKISWMSHATCPLCHQSRLHNTIWLPYIFHSARQFYYIHWGRKPRQDVLWTSIPVQELPAIIS